MKPIAPTALIERQEARVRTGGAAPATGVASWRTWYALGLALADVAGALVAALASYLAASSSATVDVLDWKVSYGLLAVLSVPFWLISQALYGSYRRVQSAEIYREYRAAVVVGLRLVAVVAVSAFAFKAPLSRLVVVVYFPTLIVASVTARWWMRRVLLLSRRHGRALVRVLLVGDPRAVRQVADHVFRNSGHGYALAGVCVPGHDSVFAHRDLVVPVLGSPDETVIASQEARMDAVAVANPACFEELTLQRLAWQLERSGIDLLVAPDVVDVAGPRIRVAPLTGLPLLHITEPPVDSWARRAVSGASRLIALPLTLALLPLMLLVAAAIVIDSGRPVFYRQVRVGHRTRTFDMLKFRTMVVDADQLLEDLRHLNEHDGPLFKARNDPRVTRVGRWLRKYSLDELPQVLNVLKGDMVFVGPRPCLPHEMSRFGQVERRRFLTKPGMTGLWQINGRASIPWEDAIRIDLYYVENWSLTMDLLILLRTLRVVLAGGGY